MSSVKKTKNILIGILAVVFSTLLVVGFSILKSATENVAYAETLQSFSIEETAEIRKYNPLGIRFTTNLDSSVKEKVGELTDVEYGTLLIPADLLDGELTTSTPNVLNAKVTKWQDEDTYTVVLGGKDGIDLPESYYNRPISARSYVMGKNGEQDVIYYTSNTATKSIGYVAKMNVLTGADTSELLTTIANKTTTDIDMDDMEIGIGEKSSFIYNEKALPRVNVKIGGIIAPSSVYNVEIDNESVVSFENGFLQGKTVGATQVTFTLGSETKTITVTSSNTILPKTDYKILVPNGTLERVYSDSLKYSATELKSLIKEASGVDLEIVTETGIESTNGKYISLGNTQLAEKEKITVSSKKDTASVVTTKNNTVFVVGNTDDGTLYGVYEMLNDLVGYEYFAKNVYSLENSAQLNLPTDTEFVPDIEYNFAPSKVISDDNNLLNRYKMKTWYGDIIPIGNGRIHNTFNVLPPFAGESGDEGNLKAHPEWYASKKDLLGKYNVFTYSSNGRQTPYEICFNARGNSSEYSLMLQTAINVYKQYLTENPDLDKMSLSVRDNMVWCQCDACKAEGNGADNAIGFVNDVCAGIRQWFVDNKDPRLNTFRMIFLAYNEAEAAPKVGTALDKYLDIWFADSFGVYVMPLDDPNIADNTKETYQNLTDWKNILDANNNKTDGVRNNKLLVWTYNANMKNFFAPYGSFESMRGNYRISNAYGANTVYNFTHNEQSSWSSLKTYLSTKLAWNSNPSNSEWDGWIDNYFTNMYGSGASQMKAWFDNFLAYAETVKELYNLEDEVINDEPHASIYQDVTLNAFFTKERLKAWIDYSKDALNSLNVSDAKYATYRDNIYLEQLSPIYLMLEIYGEDLTKEEYNEYALTFVQNVQSLDIKSLCLDRSIDDAVEKYSELEIDETVVVGKDDAKVASQLFGANVVSVKNGTEEILVGENVNISTVGEYTLIVKYSDKSTKYYKLLVGDKIIKTVSDLSVLKFDGTNNVTGKYYLGNDIDGEGATISGAGYKWNQNTGFCGDAVFDGLGHTISNITVSGWGIFGTLGKSTVKNVNFTNVSLGSGDSVLLARNMYNTQLENVNVEFNSISNSHGLLVADQTGTGSRLTNVTITADKVVTNAFGKQIDLSAGSNCVKFTNVTLITREGTTLGTGGNGENETDPLDSIPGVIVEIENQNYIVEDTFYAENGVGVTLIHSSLNVGDTFTYNENPYTVTTNGEITLPLTGLTIGEDNEVVLEGSNTITFTKVIGVTKLIKTVEDLSVLKFDGTNNVTGKYYLGNDIDGEGATISGASYNWNQNTGFCGDAVFDGLGHTISNITVSSWGIFGTLGRSTVKNVNFTNVSLGSGDSVLLAKNMYNTQLENVNVEFNSISNSHGLLVADQTGAGSRLTNVTITADKVVTNAFGQKINLSAGSNCVKFTNVTLITREGTTLGTGGNGENETDPLDSIPGVIVIIPKIEDVNTLI